MKIQMNAWARVARAAAVVAAGAALLPAHALRAQGASADGRWDAWVGCWVPSGAPTGADVSMLCIVPSVGVSAVDLVTVADGKEVSREHVDASGRVVNNTRDGCNGWERADWSRDEQRVYLHADYTCGNGRRQVSTALLGMSATGEMLDIQGLSAGKNSGVRVTRYRAASDLAGVPADLAAAVGTRSMATDAARVAASAPLRTDDVIEASAHVDAPVVEAWLANHDDRISVDAQDLVAMANAGVPGDVTDVMVALSNPDRFAVNPALTGAASGYADGVAPNRLNGVVGSTADTTRRATCPYSAYGWDYGNQCAYSTWYGYSPYGPYGGYGYGSYYGYGPAYGYGYGYGAYGGWYGGGAPVIVIQNPDNNSTSGHGHVVKGRGYVSGQGAPSGASGQRGASQSSAPAGGAGSSGSAGSSGGRTAHKSGGGLL
jgi:hypothetical protein